MKTIPILRAATLCMLFISSGWVFSQDLGTRQNIESSDFYVFTEAGGQYVPSIEFNDASVGGIPFQYSDGTLTYSGSYSVNLSDAVTQSGVGYDFILGFGYQLNKNIGIELEVGYSSISLGSTSFSTESSSFGTGNISGTTFTDGNTSGSGTGSISGSSLTLTSIPILFGLSVQERSGQFQPMASLGVGVCPSFIDADNFSLRLSESGTFSSSAGNGTYSVSGFNGGSVNTQTAYPFAFKLKAGFDYAFSPYASLGLRAWAMGLVNSNFGDELQSDLFGAIGLNAALKFRF